MLRPTRLLRPRTCLSLATTQSSKRTLIPLPPPRAVTTKALPTALLPQSEEAEQNRAYMRDVLSKNEELRRVAREGGGAKSVERWKSKGKDKLTARER